jgi:hypothetical protein
MKRITRLGTTFNYLADYENKLLGITKRNPKLSSDPKWISFLQSLDESVTKIQQLVEEEVSNEDGH